MANLAIQNVSLTGLAPAFVAASGGGDSLDNNGRTLLHVKNGGGVPITVTVDSTQPCSYGFDHDAAVSVPAGAERILGPFPQGRFGSTANITYSAVTTVTVAALNAA